MSGKERPANGNVPQIPILEEHIEDDAESIGSEIEDQIEVNEEPQDIERPALEIGSGDSGLDSPLEFAIGSSLDSGHDSPLEGAVGGEVYDGGASYVDITSQERSRIKPEKEDLFRKFFREEYSQPNAQILGRHEYPDERPRLRDSNINPLVCSRGVDEANSNKTGATGQNIPTENIPGCSRSRAENDPLLPSIRTRADCSARSADNGLVEFRSASDESRRGLSQGSSSISFSSRQTASTDNMQTSPLFYSDSSEGNITDAERMARENPVRHRRIGIVTHPVLVKSKSAVAGSSAYVPTDGRDKCKKTSEAMSICSEPSRKISSEAMSVASDPLPIRKISKDSSTDMSLDDEASNHPELAYSLESEPCLPMPDIDPEAIRNLAALTVSSDVSMDTEQDIGEDRESVGEQGRIVTDTSGSHDAESLKHQSDST